MTPPRTTLLALAISVLAALVALPGAAPQATSYPPRSFTMTCAYYGKRAQVDPIVSPGIQASAHSHDFYGRVDVSDFMFAAAAWPPDPRYPDDPGWVPISSSCRNYGDWAAYWFPTPKLNGAAIQSGDLLETWRTDAGERVAVPPFGMAFVAGNASAKAPGADPHLTFTCGALDDPESPAPTMCATGAVTAQLTFPDCWDGAAALRGNFFPAGVAPLHFAYGNPDCAPGWRRVAQLVTRQQFKDPATGLPLTNPLAPDGTVALSFASGAYYTYHGDFLNSWGMSGFTEWINRCLNGDAPHLMSASDTGGCTFR